MTVHYLYRVFDADGALLYIGTTTDWRKRIRRHLAAWAPWSTEFAIIDVDILVGVTTTKAAHAAELAAIASEAPWHNVIGQRQARDPAPMPRSVREHQMRSLAYSRGLWDGVGGSPGDRL